MTLSKFIYNLSNLAKNFGYKSNKENDECVTKMRQEINRIGRIEFKIEQFPDGSWTAESVNLDGIITGDASTKNMSSTIKDAIFTYFEIPPHLCSDFLLQGDNEPVTIKQNFYAVTVRQNVYA